MNPLPPHYCGGMALSAWLERIGRDYQTGYRWRKLGWIVTVDIGGSQYITEGEIKRFWERAEKGEFKKEEIKES